jgi:hypothetical protein
MNIRDQFGLRQTEDIIAAFEILGVLREPRTTERVLVQSVALNHGSHGTVENEYALG